MFPFVNKLLSSFFENNQKNTSTIIPDKRKQALKIFESQGMPSQKQEQWKYFPTNSCFSPDYEVLHQKNINILENSSYLIRSTNTYKLIFINGHYTSSSQNNKYTIQSLGEAFEKNNPLINQYFGLLANTQEGLLSLNMAFFSPGVFIHIPDNLNLDMPIEILFLSTAEKDSFYQPRNLIILGKNTNVNIIERHHTVSPKINTLTNSVTEIFVDSDSFLNYIKYQENSPNSNLIDNTFVRVQSQAVPKFYTFSLGGNLTRNNLNIYLEGTNSEAHLKGLTILTQKEIVDHHTNVEHLTPHTQSYELYKGIFDGESHGIFNGRVLVAIGALKTNGFQQNHNMVISKKASVHTKPELEIFNDDVKCSHGCTIGQLDTQALFYLQSRGIPKKEAETLLLSTFAREILEELQDETIKKNIRKNLNAKLKVSFNFDD